MACVNSKSIKNALKTFVKENGRDPSMEEFKKLITGRSGKKNEKEKVS